MKNVFIIRKILLQIINNISILIIYNVINNKIITNKKKLLFVNNLYLADSY